MSMTYSRPSGVWNFEENRVQMKAICTVCVGMCGYFKIGFEVGVLDEGDSS